VLIVDIIVLIALVGLAIVYRSMHSKRKLRESFGPEYDQLVQERGSSREADRELVRRKQEHAKLELRPISEQDRAAFLESWEHLQASFIDDPVFSMNSAEQLVSTALEARGYPGGDREEQLALLSVDYSGKLTDYRAAQDVKRRVEGGGAAGPAATNASIEAYNEIDPETVARTDAAAEAGVAGDTDPYRATVDTDTDAALADGTTSVAATAPVTATTVSSAPATTEDIRQALLSYRALFDELIAAPGTEVARPGGAETEAVPAQAWSTRRDETIEQKVEQ
jgi:hypothetical protein